MILTPLFWLSVGLAGVEWIAVWRRWGKVTVLTKPGMMLALLAWFVQNAHLAQADLTSQPLFWFGLGLAASLVGDVMLMLPDRFFISGLLAFLVAHLCYLVGFNERLPVLGWFLLVPLLVVGLGAGIVYRGILQGLARKPGGRKLRGPLIIYGVVISLMLCSALVSFWRPGWTPSAALLVSAGAGLFWLSDSILAANRFVRSLKWGDLAVMVTYQTGQIALAAGALLAYGVRTP